MSLGGGVVIWGTEMAVATPSRLERPAFYALRPGGWRDLVTLLHPPYTAWHLSYVALGAAAAPVAARRPPGRRAGRVLPRRRHLRARARRAATAGRCARGCPTASLIALAAVALAGAVAIGIVGAVTVSVGAAAVRRRRRVPRRGLQPRAVRRPLPHRRLVRRWRGARSPRLTGYWINALEFTRPPASLVAAALLRAERGAAPPEHAGARAAPAHGRGQRRQQLADGRRIALTSARLAAPLDGALSALSLAVVLLACSLVVARL